MFYIIEFQEEYKRLDNLCKDYLSSFDGVTAYIRQMDDTPIYHQRLVKTWDVDYKRLKRVRWVRNQLAHVVGTLESDLCTENDLEWVQDFHERIINGNDPFAIIRTSKNATPCYKEFSAHNKKNTQPIIEEPKIIAAAKTGDAQYFLQVGQCIEAKTHVELLNTLLGKKYRGWQSCRYEFNAKDVIWMIKLDNKKSKEGWRNALVENGERVVENYVGLDYERLPKHEQSVFHERRYIFDVMNGPLKNRIYVFRGVFDFAITEGSNDYRVWKKVADTVNFKDLLDSNAK